MDTSSSGAPAGSVPGDVSRRAALIGGTGLAATLISGSGRRLTAAGAARVAVATTTAGFASGGLGLGLEEWERRFGPREAGQGGDVFAIAGVRYTVLQREQRVYSVYWAAADGQTIPLDRAKAQAARFLPADTDLVEVYDAPGAGTVPLLTVQLFHSPALGGRFRLPPVSRSGNFVAVYLLDQTYQADVLRANLFVGNEPPRT